MFFVFALTMMLLLHGYVGARMIAPFTVSPGLQVLYWLVILVLGTVPIGAMALRFRGVENDLVDNLLWIGYTSLGIFSLAFVLFIFRDLALIAANLLGKLGMATGPEPGVDPGPFLERRQFLLILSNWGILGMTTILGVVGFFQARFKPEIKEVKVPLRNFSEKLGQLRIVQITDLHVGPTIKADFVQEVVDSVNRLNPDLILFTGDMVDGSVKRLSKDVEPLRQLQATYGTYFVTGNHEYYSGADHWVSKVRELGMTPLMNEHEVLDIDGEKLILAGVTDYMAHTVHRSHKSDPERALRGAPSSTPTLLLAHQPGTADQLGTLDIDLMVCGHTHGGQYIPFNWAVAKAHRYVAGLYEQEKTQIYVNQGTGYWGPPLRLGIPSEITLLQFKDASLA